MPTVTLIDGTEVDSASEAWRLETFNRWKQVQEVLAMRGAANVGKRAAFIEKVDFLEGEEAGRRLREAIKKAWSGPA